MLEEAYTASRYSIVGYGRGEAEECIGAARRVLEVLAGVKEALESPRRS